MSPLIRQFAHARTSARRRAIVAQIRRACEGPPIAAILESCLPGLRWVLPELWLALDPKHIAVGDVVALLDSRDGLVIYNACELLRARSWSDRCVPELVEIARTHRDGDAALGAMNALRAARSEAAMRAMIAMTRGPWRHKWPRGRVIEAIARNVRPVARPVLARAFTSGDEYERLAAAAGLARLGDRDARAYVRAKMREPEHRALARYLASEPKRFQPGFMARAVAR